jgi:hypothetical protein
MCTTTAYEPRVRRSVTWKCTKCGEYMVSLWWEDDRGYFADEREPLLCPQCATVRDFFWAVAELSDTARSVSEFIKLLTQLMQFVAD